MITTDVTKEMIEEWIQIYRDYAPSIQPNRKTGNEIDEYFRNNYHHQIISSQTFKQVVELNIMENEHSRVKLPNGMVPHVKSYCVGDVLVGIDYSSGEFHIESQDINKAIPIYDDLFVYRGLDEDDLKNYVMVAQYVMLTQK
ncbi:hypothetical protein [Lacrimispora xylanisolvens]|jgi:hypothetical protein|uniref:Uncharacterized protein n=1 Tax=Lacrimispora xylanisolvens TaxID=384636 RepID=A0A2S6HAI7_9FIRM|nr:hypothetical protein [Hungatella xylanolytica]MBE5976125.1 hypothetical protein [Paenibacillaceae bacterium]PPK74504.1 hypothetical protein BXY41_1256 [Hungatella xylanolytica]DAM03320.1 MAG TPA: hypothetical protein [Inoviridae sp.]